MTFEGLDSTLVNLAKIVLVGSVTGAIAETVDFEKHRRGGIVGRAFIDDNFFVPVVSGFVMSLYVIL